MNPGFGWGLLFLGWAFIELVLNVPRGLANPRRGIVIRGGID